MTKTLVIFHLSIIFILILQKLYQKYLGAKKEPELFHEYLRFYQDISTTFGLLNSSHVLNKIKDMYHYVKKLAIERNTTIKLPLKGFDKESTDINLRLFKLYLKYTQTECLSTSELLEVPVKEEEIVKTLNDQELPVPVWKVTTTDLDSFPFDTHAIMEGICHNLQKEIYGLTEPYMQALYNLSKMIWDYMLPEQKDNVKAFIDLSEVSLMHLMSISVFIETLIKVQNSEIVIFKTSDNTVSIDVRFEGETVWLRIDDMASLFEKSRSTINEHILNIFEEGELEKESSVRKIGNSDFSIKPTNYYNYLCRL